MRIYRLDISPSDDAGDGEDWDEYFGSLRAAKRRRAELIRENPTLENCRYHKTYAIERIDVRRDLSPKRLALAILNRRAYLTGTAVEVMSDYEPPREKRPLDDDNVF